MDTITLTKIISALIYPTGLIAVLLVLWIGLAWIGFKRLARVCGVLSVLLFLLASNAGFATWLGASLENQYPQRPLHEIPTHDAIVVLGGGLRVPLPPAQHTQIGHGSDRLWYATRLYRANKAKWVVLAGGNVFPLNGLQGEAYYAKQLLEEWGVPTEAILLEAESRTTAENSRAMNSLLTEHDIQDALLVTSALHMPRAYSLFSTLDIPVTPVSADVLIRQAERPSVLKWIPSAAALQLSTVAMHEYYGMWFHQISSRLNALISSGS